MQAAYYRHRHFAPRPLIGPTKRCILVQSQCTHLIVATCISRENSPQMYLSDDPHVVQTLAAHGADQAFRIAIIRYVGGGTPDVLLILSDWHMVRPSGTRGTGSCRARRNIDQDEFSAANPSDHQDVEQLEPAGWDYEHVDCCGIRAVVAQERVSAGAKIPHWKRPNRSAAPE